MADTTVPATLTPEVFQSDFFEEYIAANPFIRYFGNDENALIQVNEDLTKVAGDTIVYEFVEELEEDDVGGGTVIGNEEALRQRSYRQIVRPIRKGVAVKHHELKKSPIDLMLAKKGALKQWNIKKMRADIIAALYSINGVPYYDYRYNSETVVSAATETQKDAWLVDNVDRVLFGALVSNGSSLDHSAALANIDSTNDRFSPAILSMAKRRARTANPPLRPHMLENNGQEWFVCFAGSRAFADFKRNSEMTQANRDARPRDPMQNPLFTDGDLLWDGVIVIEVPQIPIISAVGAAGIDVEPVFLVGAQALAIAWAMHTEVTVDETDHKWRKSVASAEIRGVGKMTFGTGASDTDDLKDHGVHTIYVASIPDA